MNRLILLVVSLLAFAAPLTAATYTVTNTNNAGAGSLRDAIGQANASAGADTIVFDTAGVFSTVQTITLGGGQLVITGAVTIDAPSAANRRVTISANGNSRVFSVQLSGAGTVMLNHLTIRDGLTTDDGGKIQMASPAGSTLALDDCTVTGGNARDGGGIDAQVATLSLTNTLVSSNTASRTGGGIRATGSSAVTLLGVHLRYNNANHGAGNAHNGTLTNCTFSNNRANSHGGAIYNLAGAGDVLSLVHCTLTLNHSNQDNSGGGDGGGIRRVSGAVALVNTLVSGNDALLGAQDDISGALTSLGHNLIGIATGGTGFTNGVNGDLIGTNAYLGPLQNNGGPTFTHALLAGSPAIDAAATIPGSTDQRGVLRNGALNDIGAYELLPETYEYWAAHTFPTAANTGMNQDYDGDGKSNIFEFGAGSDPTSATSSPVVTTSVAGGNFMADFGLSPLAPAGTSVLRFSTNLVTWQNVAANLYQVVGADPVRNVVLYRVTLPTSTAPKLFVRLEHLP